MEPQSMVMSLRHLQTDGDYSLRSRPAEPRWSGSTSRIRVKSRRRAVRWTALFRTAAVQS
jgi:hypothetical protein